MNSYVFTAVHLQHPDRNMQNMGLIMDIRVHQNTVFLVAIYLAAQNVRIGTVDKHVKYFANQ